MDLPNTVMSLARDPNMVAWRPRGVVIRLTAGLVLERAMVPKSYPWKPSFADLVAGDWSCGTPQQLYELLQGQANGGGES